VVVIATKTWAMTTITTTTNRQQQPKGGRNGKMTGIESNIISFASTIGFGGIAGFLVGFVLTPLLEYL
jgi:hypothetical protein